MPERYSNVTVSPTSVSYTHLQNVDHSFTKPPFILHNRACFQLFFIVKNELNFFLIRFGICTICLLYTSLYPAILACWHSEDGQREFAAWQVEQAHHANNEKQKVPTGAFLPLSLIHI